MMSAARKSNSIYLFETQPQYRGHVETDYVLNTGMNQHEIENEHRRAVAQKVPSVEMDKPLRNMDATEKEANVRSGRGASAIDLPTSNVETAREILSGMIGSESGVDTARTIDSSIAVADMSSSVFNIPMGVLKRNLPNDTFRQVLYAVMDEVNDHETEDVDTAIEIESPLTRLFVIDKEILELKQERERLFTTFGTRKK